MKYVEKNDPRESHKDDPRDNTDRPPARQTSKPRKQNPQKATDSSLPDTPKPDLEKWQKAGTS